MIRRTGLPRLLDRPRPAILALSDGSIFRGFAAGAPGCVTGEVVFNTAMTGYQEMLTDPSYHGQILCLTTSHVGQVGANAADAESEGTWARALIVQDLDAEPSSWRAEIGFDSWLEEHGVTVGWGFDVRAIVRRIRESGAVPGVLVADAEPTRERAMSMVRSARGTDRLQPRPGGFLQPTLSMERRTLEIAVTSGRSASPHYRSSSSTSV